MLLFEGFHLRFLVKLVSFFIYIKSIRMSFLHVLICVDIVDVVIMQTSFFQFYRQQRLFSWKIPLLQVEFANLHCRGQMWRGALRCSIMQMFSFFLIVFPKEVILNKTRQRMQGRRAKVFFSLIDLKIELENGLINCQ